MKEKLGLGVLWSLAGVCVVLVIGLFASLGYLGYLIFTEGPIPYERCEDEFPEALLITAKAARNDNILCKVIGPDLVERSVWLDSEGVVLR